MRKPPYKAYRKKEKKEKHIEIPEKIDTREAEQLVEDIYRLGEFLKTHWKKLFAVLSALLLLGGGYGGFRLYETSKELKSAEVVDRGLSELENGKTDEALKVFSSVKEDTPSGRVAAFLYGKLTNSTDVLENLSKVKSLTISPASKVALAGVLINGGKLKEPESVLLSVSRSDDWTYPQALYYLIVINVKRGNLAKARETFDILQADYGNSIFSQLAQELLK